MKKIILLLTTLFFLITLIGIVKAANCGGGVQCNCGDILTSSQTMWYDLTNCANGLTIAGYDITLDCAGHKIYSSGPPSGGYGIRTTWSDDIIKNCEIRGYEKGIWLFAVSNNTLVENTLYDNIYGVYIDQNSYTYFGNNITNNTITTYNFGLGIYDYGIYLYTSYNNTLSGNTLIGINYNDYGIYLFQGSNNTLSENTLYYHEFNGIYLYGSSKNTLSGNIIDQSGYGIEGTDYSSNNILSGNILNDNARGIVLYGDHSSHNILSSNKINNNGELGISLGSSYSKVYGNNITNHDYGVLLQGSSYNTFWANNFTDNTINALEGSNNNDWNLSTTGNYWDDFANNSGFPNYYEISGPGDGRDYHPLVCGNGKLQFGEECDDGNLLNEDGCSDTCQLEYCGDGVLQGGLGEQCDDGNTNPGDGCDSECYLEVCGNGRLQFGEECDDGNQQNGDGCDDDVASGGNCKITACGNGVLTPVTGEECDDGNTASGDGCSADCKLEGPTVTIISPENCTDYPVCTEGYYHKDNIPFNFSAEGEISYAAFNLDEQGEVEISEIMYFNGTHTLGDFYFTNQEDGFHNISVTADNQSSGLVYFFYCLGDINHDKKMDIYDIVKMVEYYGKSC